MRLEAQEGGVPDAQETQDHRHVLAHRCSLEVAIHGMRAIAELLHDDRTILQRQRDHPDSRAHGEATPDPVPEAKHVAVIDTERFRLVQSSRDRNHVLAHGVRPQLLHQPGANRAGVQHRLSSGERLRDDDYLWLSLRLLSERSNGVLRQIRNICKSKHIFVGSVNVVCVVLAHFY